MTKITSILSLVVVFLVVALGLSIRSNMDHSIVEAQVKKGIEQGLPATTHKVDEHGSEHAIVPDEGITREAADILYADLLDSIAKLNKLKSADQVDSYDEYSIRKKAAFSGKVEPGKCDSAGDTTSKFVFTGNSFTGKGEIKKDGQMTGTLDLQMKLSVAGYWEKKWLLGSRHFYENAWSADTTVHIDTIKHIRISEAEYSRWGVSCFAGYDLLNMKPAAGVALSYELYRFKKRKKK